MSNAYHHARCINPGCNFGGNGSATGAAGTLMEQMLLVASPGAVGSTNDAVVQFSGHRTSPSLYTVTTTSADGTSIKINRAGIYLCSYSASYDSTSTGENGPAGVTKDASGTTLTTTDWPARSQDTAGDPSAYGVWGAVIHDGGSIPATDRSIVTFSFVVPISAEEAADASSGIVRFMDPYAANASATGLPHAYITPMGNFG